MKYVIEVSVIADCADDDDAEAVGAAVVQKVTGNKLTPGDRANIRRIEEATVANVDAHFLAGVAS